MFNYPRKIIIAVAPVAHVGTVLPPGARNPLTPEEISADAVGCAKAGASVVHLHVRDTKGRQVFDLGVFSKTLDLILAEVDIVINGSTGGLSTLTLEQRCVSVGEGRTSLASLNMGSTNFNETVYINTLPDIRFWVSEMKKHRVVPELEVFDAGMITTVERLAAEGVLEPPFNFNFCLGFKGAMPADPRNLSYLASLLPRDAHWGLTHEGMKDFKLTAAALGLGATQVRVGFEDGATFGPGRIATTNTELTEQLAELVDRLGFEVATPNEARAILGVKT